jgi:hypothetical protein
MSATPVAVGKEIVAMRSKKAVNTIVSALDNIDFKKITQTSITITAKEFEAALPFQLLPTFQIPRSWIRMLQKVVPKCPKNLMSLFEFDLLSFMEKSIGSSPGNDPYMVYTEGYDRNHKEMNNDINEYLKFSRIAPEIDNVRNKVMNNFFTRQGNAEYSVAHLENLSAMLKSFVNKLPTVDTSKLYMDIKTTKALQAANALSKSLPPKYEAVLKKKASNYFSYHVFTTPKDIVDNGYDLTPIVDVDLRRPYQKENYKDMKDKVTKAVNNLIDVRNNYKSNLDLKAKFNESFNRANWLKKKFKKDKNTYNYEQFSFDTHYHYGKILDVLEGHFRQNILPSQAVIEKHKGHYNVAVYQKLLRHQEIAKESVKLLRTFNGMKWRSEEKMFDELNELNLEKTLSNITSYLDELMQNIDKIVDEAEIIKRFAAFKTLMPVRITILRGNHLAHFKDVCS